MKITLTLSAFALATLAIACSGTSAPESLGASPQQASAADPARVEGTFRFDLHASEVAGAVKEECAKESGGDRAKADACFAAIEAQAKREKIRFAKDKTGRMVWSSFGVDGDKVETFLEVPVELKSDGPSHVLATVAGKATGFQAAKIEKSEAKAMRVEIIDATTIAMRDPKKGRLVYTKE